MPSFGRSRMPRGAVITRMCGRWITTIGSETWITDFAIVSRSQDHQILWRRCFGNETKHPGWSSGGKIDATVARAVRGSDAFSTGLGVSGVCSGRRRERPAAIGDDHASARRVAAGGSVAAGGGQLSGHGGAVHVSRGHQFRSRPAVWPKAAILRRRGRCAAAARPALR